ncbi:MAG: hypothetical protein L0Z50_06275 [Verrucomicrobiales bacterium]|nr:hypothetical protein [Verrucomicrobiales bacterium]
MRDRLLTPGRDEPDDLPTFPFHFIHVALLASCELAPRFDLQRASIVFHDSNVFQPEHLLVVIGLVLRGDLVTGQNFPSDLNVTFARFALDSEGLPAVFVEKVTHLQSAHPV